MAHAGPTISRSPRRLASPVVVGIAAAGLLLSGCTDQNAATPQTEAASQPGRAESLPPLAGTPGGGPVLPVFPRAVVSPTNATAVSTQPTMESGLNLTGQYTFALAPLTPDPNVRWTTWSTGEPRWRIPASANLLDGAAYQWRVTGPDGTTRGPYSFTVDLSATNTADGDSSSTVGVTLASGIAHYTWQSHTMEAAAGSFGIGLDYSPVNARSAGTTAGWRMVVPSANGWDQLRVGTGGVVSLHAKNNSWVSYKPAGNGAYQPVGSADGKPSPTGMFGTLVLNSDGSYTITDTTATVTTFAKPDPSGRSYVTGVSTSGQQGIQQIYDGESGRLTSLIDTATGRTVTLRYGGWGCPVYRGFADTPSDLLCQIEFWDGSKAGFGYTANAAGVQLARLVDYAGSASGALVSDLAYDDSGRLTAVRSPTSAAAVASPAAARVAGSDPAEPQLLTQVSYDPQGRVATVTNPAPSLGAPRVSATYSYGANNTTTTAVAPGGSTSQITYDPATFRTLARSADGVTTRTEYDANGNPVKSVDAAGGVTTSEYDSDGVMVAKRGPGGSQVTYGYDRTYATKDPNDPGQALLGLDVSYWPNTTWSGPPATSELGPRPSPGAPLPTALSTTWASPPIPNAGGWSARMTGRLTLPSPADPAKPDKYQFVVNGSNRPQLWIDNVKCVERSCADGITLAGGPHSIRIDMAVTEGTQGSVQLQFARNGQALQNVPMSALTPAYHLTTYQGTKDALRANTETVLTNRTAYSQPQVGQVAAMWNNAGLTTQTTYESGPGQLGTQPITLSSEARAEAVPTNQARVTGTVMPAGNATALTYWGKDERSASGCADQGAELQAGLPRSFTASDPATGQPTGPPTVKWFMADGSVAAVRDGDSAPLCMYYDDAMRLVRTSQAGADQESSAVIDYAVDGNPLASSVSSTVRQPGQAQPTTTASRVLKDLLGREVESVDDWGTRKLTTYTPLGQVAQVTTTIADGSYSTVQRYTYQRGQIVRTEISDSVSGSAPVLTADATYDQAGRLTGVTYSNGTSGATTYGANQLPASLTWTDAAATPWRSTHTYSPAGRILGTTLAKGSSTSTYDYVYDSATRLASATLTTDQQTSAKSWAYQYDANSNRTAQVVDGQRQIAYTYDKADQLIGVSGDPKLSGEVRYDEQGSITRIGPLEIAYDVTGDARAITDTSTKSSVTYQRNANRDVIAKTTTNAQGTPSTIRYSQSGLLLNGDSRPTMHMVTLVGGVTVERQLAAPQAGADAASARAAGQTWLYPAINGNTMFRTDGAGATSDAGPVVYDPFGQVLTTASALASPPGLQLGYLATGGFQTEALSVEVSLMGARLYLPGLGRFTQVDPQAGGSANNYDYASQDPINGRDTTGAAAWWKWLIAISASVAISVASGGTLTWANAGIIAAGLSTATATALSITAGAVIGAGGAIGSYAATTAALGNEWSWTEFAFAAGIGVLSGIYSGLAGMNNVGKSIVAGSMSAAKANGETGMKSFLSGMYTTTRQSGFSAAVKGAIAKYVTSPVQTTHYMLSMEGWSLSGATSAVNSVVCTMAKGAVSKSVLSGGAAVAAHEFGAGREIKYSIKGTGYIVAFTLGPCGG